MFLPKLNQKFQRSAEGVWSYYDVEIKHGTGQFPMTGFLMVSRLRKMPIERGDFIGFPGLQILFWAMDDVLVLLVVSWSLNPSNRRFFPIHQPLVVFADDHTSTFRYLTIIHPRSSPSLGGDSPTFVIPFVAELHDPRTSLQSHPSPSRWGLAVHDFSQALLSRMGSGESFLSFLPFGDLTLLQKTTIFQSVDRQKSSTNQASR